ncbi:MAG: TlpA family protein disulfide reductase [Gemmataceae bacterium]|nr:TlpA family protein disulfide reductase [Gemmataceae bacterium]MCI0739546.1 TlpA family protein disulfide reductase [Gemmataceae bacterium]
MKRLARSGALLGLALLAIACLGAAGAAKKLLLDARGALTAADPTDPAQKGSYQKVHPFKAKAGKSYRIDLASDDFDAYLRLENADGKQLDENDDSVDGLNSRLVYSAKKDEEIRVIATSFAPQMTGEYRLRIAYAGAQDILENKAVNLHKLSSAEQRAILERVKKHFAERSLELGLRDVRLCFQISMSLEHAKSPRGDEVLRDFAKSFAAAADPKTADFATSLEGAARRLKLPGGPIEIKGTTLNGKPIDWRSYRGKVVLVEFWMSMCPLCQAELPNVKKTYADYKDKGFDVVGVSLDRNQATLAQFVKKQKLTWACIFEPTARQSLAEYYGVFSIPLAILVDRDGTVVSMNARGPELHRLVAKLVEKK